MGHGFFRTAGGACLAALIALSLATQARAADPKAGKTVEHQGLRIQLPGMGWEQARQEEGTTAVQFVRLVGPGRVYGVSVWAVDVPPEERNLSRKEHATRPKAK